jgi:hypothetical protein
MLLIAPPRQKCTEPILRNHMCPLWQCAAPPLWVHHIVRKKNSLCLIVTDFWTWQRKTCWCTFDFPRGLHRDVVYLCWPIAPSYMSPNAGGGGVAGSQPMSAAVHRSQNKLWRSNYIFNLFNLWSPSQNFNSVQCTYLRLFPIVFALLMWVDDCLAALCWFTTQLLVGLPPPLFRAASS